MVWQQHALYTIVMVIKKEKKIQWILFLYLLG